MKKENLICGQCNAQLEDKEESYIEVIDEHNGNWYQCFECYDYERQQFYDNMNDESYADFYCRTSCSCCARNEDEEY